MNMKALVKNEEGVELRHIPIPEPAEGEVLVKVLCSALCRTDLYLAQGRLPTPPSVTLGHECAGVVYRLGPGVSQELLGERVAVFPWIGCENCPHCVEDQEKLFFRCPQRRMIGWHQDGCFAQFLRLRANRCIPIPNEMSFQAGSFLEPLCAALGILRAPLKQAESIGLLGKNRFAELSSIILSEHARIEHQRFEAADNLQDSFDLVIENQATDTTIEAAMRALKPGGLLLLKSRPAESQAWPIRLQVEKEIEVKATAYGTLRMALLLLNKKGHLFKTLWADPVALTHWPKFFHEEQEHKKIFFLPNAN